VSSVLYKSSGVRFVCDINHSLCFWVFLLVTMRVCQYKTSNNRYSSGYKDRYTAAKLSEEYRQVIRVWGKKRDLLY